MEGTLWMSIFKILSMQFYFWTQITTQKWLQIRSTVKFTEQNFHFLTKTCIKYSHQRAFCPTDDTLHNYLILNRTRSFNETNTNIHGLHRDSNPGHRASQSASLPLYVLLILRSFKCIKISAFYFFLSPAVGVTQILQSTAPAGDRDGKKCSKLCFLLSTYEIWKVLVSLARFRTFYT
jgi:hypothetical protein